MTILERNLAALELLNPLLRGRLDGDLLPSAARVTDLCSRIDPAKEGRSIADTCDIRYNALFCVLGYGAGYHVAAIAEKLGYNGSVWVLEPDLALLRESLSTIDHSEVFAKSAVIFHTGEEGPGDLAAMYRGAEGQFVIGVQVVDHPPSWERLDGIGQKWLKTIEGAAEAARSMLTTVKVLSASDMKHRIANAYWYCNNKGIGLLKDLHKGCKGVVISDGPSLAKDIGLLKTDSHVVMVATQTALKPMLACGVRPHYVCALDWSDLSMRFYEGLTAYDVWNIPLVVESKVYPGVVKGWPGLVIVNNDPVLNKLEGDELCEHRKIDGKYDGLPASGTVAQMCYYLCRWMGMDPVALIGQDLGFLDGQYYGSGAAIHESWACELNEFNTLEMMEWQRVKRMGQSLMTVPCNTGGTIYSDQQMHSYRTQFERDFITDAAKGLTTFDCSIGGAAKAGTKVMPFAEFVA